MKKECLSVLTMTNRGYEGLTKGWEEELDICHFMAKEYQMGYTGTKMVKMCTIVTD